MTFTEANQNFSGTSNFPHAWRQRMVKSFRSETTGTTVPVISWRTWMKHRILTWRMTNRSAPTTLLPAFWKNTRQPLRSLPNAPLFTGKRIAYDSFFFLHQRFDAQTVRNSELRDSTLLNSSRFFLILLDSSRLFSTAYRKACSIHLVVRKAETVSFLRKRRRNQGANKPHGMSTHWIPIMPFAMEKANHKSACISCWHFRKPTASIWTASMKMLCCKGWSWSSTRYNER